MDKWVLDATMGCRDGLFCFCPIEGDIEGDFTVVTGMNILSDRPPGELVAIVHERGQEAVDTFMTEHLDALAIMRTRKRNATVEDVG